MKNIALLSAVSTLALSLGSYTHAENNHMDKNQMKHMKENEMSREIKNHSKNMLRDFQSYRDGANVTLTGTVQKIDGHDFIMRYGSQTIEVELEGWNWNKPDLEKYLTLGQRVTVSGEVDDDWFDSKELEAENIYLDAEKVYFYVKDVNPAYISATRSNDSQNKRMNNVDDGSFYAVRGKIKKIDGQDVVLTSEKRTYRVDVSGLDYDPLDKEGMQQLSVGDRVYVYGEIDDDFFEGKEIEADVIVTINDISDKTVASN